MRRLLGLALASLIACAAHARPLDLDDLLQTESLGAVGLTPHGLIIERRRAYAQAPAFDTEAELTIGRTDLLILDGSDARPLLPRLTDGGYMAGPLSPDGARLLVYRLRGSAWDAGVVTLATGAVVWLDLTPELAPLGRAAQWRSNRELLMLVRAPGDLPLALRRGRQGPARIAKAWQTMAKGEEPSASVLGSGRFLPEPAPRGAVVRVQVDSGVVQTLARGDVEDLEISPDGRRAALVLLGEALQPPPDRLIRVAEPTRRRSLALIDLTSGAMTRPCPSCELAPLLLSWSPHSDALLVFGRQEGVDWAQGGFWKVGLSRSERLAPGMSPKLAFTSEGLPIVRAAWLGDAPVILAGPSGGRSDLYRLDGEGPLNLTALLPTPPAAIDAQDAEGLVLAAGGAVWRVDARGVTTALSAGGGEAAAPAPGLGDGYRLQINPPRPQGLVWIRRGAWLEAYDRGGRRTRLMTPPKIQMLASDGRQMVVADRDAHGVERLLRLAPRSPPSPVLTLNPALAALDPPDILAVHHRGPDGERLTSWLFLPKDRPPGAKLTLIVTPYPGAVFPSPPPVFGADAASLQTNPYGLAAHGEAVLVPSLPRDRARGEPGAGLADQILTAVDAAILTGQVDPDRVALFGHSFGGYAALMSAAQSPRFKSVIAKAAVTDIAALRGDLIPHDAAVPQDGYELNFGSGWSELGQGHLGTDPTTDPERYRRNSPISHIGQIRAPVLLIAGDQDEVSVGQSQAMFAALYRQGRDACLVTYWGERHLIASPGDLRDLYARVFIWLDRTLPKTTPKPPTADEQVRPRSEWSLPALPAPPI
ncbi:prolyl oligopeptidase family serine peptidase [Phenylobacterium aquaticum]|uniref:S9 family peptidase n=1 Tax=Phenylobacterium aquaticum TaxID=1763816 RepID=UPI001F5C6631|nr:prolyl oligopeptidase family serine peptidase [Phenylobacterium aquaticum]MCI3135387.1 prolyl oligopeptidase family serine peptidase [Phenylobacterium aquaticum]